MPFEEEPTLKNFAKVVVLCVSLSAVGQAKRFAVREDRGDCNRLDVRAP